MVCARSEGLEPPAFWSVVPWCVVQTRAGRSIRAGQGAVGFELHAGLGGSDAGRCVEDGAEPCVSKADERPAVHGAVRVVLRLRDPPSISLTER